MITSIRHKGLRLLYETGSSRGLQPALAAKLSRILTAIEEAHVIEEVGLFPGWRLHLLTGDLAGFWSVTVSGNWRIIFRFEEGEARDLDLVDYH